MHTSNLKTKAMIIFILTMLSALIINAYKNVDDVNYAASTHVYTDFDTYKNNITPGQHYCQEDSQQNKSIFFIDPEEYIIFVDLQGILEKAKILLLKKAGYTISYKEICSYSADTILEIPFSNLSSGLYHIELKTATGNCLIQTIHWQNNTLQLPFNLAFHDEL